MKATQLEFRLRFLIICVIFTLGFWAPWNLKLHFDSVRTWQAIASQLYQWHWLSFVAATNAVLIVGILCALTAACLRTWGSAYLGASVVQDASMHSERMVAAGPYRYLRNPLYLGLFFLTLALALLMPLSGAVFAVVLTNLFQLRLIGAEEAYLATQFGQPYLAYKAAVPSLLPSIKPRVPPSSAPAAWPVAFLSEIAMWGVAVSFGALGWSYNAQLILQGVLISLGLSIVVRGLIPRKKGL